jgi:hypothetical protein
MKPDAIPLFQIKGDEGLNHRLAHRKKQYGSGINLVKKGAFKREIRCRSQQERSRILREGIVHDFMAIHRPECRSRVAKQRYPMGVDPMQEPDSHQTAVKFAKLLAFHCVRNSYLEELHAGISPSSQTGDYTDVKVVSPYGEIPWNRVGRISDDEMKPLMEDIVNRLYTFLFYLLTRGEPERGVPLPRKWSSPQMEASIAEMWHEDRPARNDDDGPRHTDF